ncbi:5'-nucleotidase domain-containing protein, partial [Mucuna pruriens]
MLRNISSLIGRLIYGSLTFYPLTSLFQVPTIHRILRKVNPKELVSGMRFTYLSRVPVPYLPTALPKFKPVAPSARTSTRVYRMAAAPSSAAVRDGAPSASSAIDFLSICHRLKTTKRTGWVRKDVKNPESIADHMYRMSLMALIASDVPGVDRNKCIKMAIVHDIAEAIVGDITPLDGISKTEKSQREQEALDHMCKVLGGGSTEQGKDLDEFFQSTAGDASFIFSTPTSLGFSGSSRSYSVVESSEHCILKSNEEEIAALRREFEAAKQSFLKIPDALREMPKMNPQGIYVNKNMRLDKLQVYGFDYDYTLAHYSSDLQTLIYDLAKEYLVNELRYPEVCMSFKYDPTFPIRGLYYDKSKGCLMKLDFFGSIEPDGCFFGRHRLNQTEIRDIYGTRNIGRDQARSLVGLMDFFCFSEACLLADIVQYFVDAKLEFDASYIYEDVIRAIEHVHRSGLVHRGILSDPHRYLVKNGKILHFLKMLRKRGKKLFLLTNSPYYFVDGGMRFMLEDSMDCRDSWTELFDVVIAKANKPQFYTSEHPFRCYDTKKDTLTFTKVDEFLPDKIYYHGCLKSFLQITKWKGPESEIQMQNEDTYRCEQAKFHIIQELLGKLHATAANSLRTTAFNSLMEELNEERQKARNEMKMMFNRSFGATFLTSTGQESAFAYNIHQYADVYTSKPENFLLYSPEAWLHVPFDVKIMPHHVKVPSSLFRTG